MWPYESVGHKDNSSFKWAFKIHENVITMLASSQTAHSISRVLLRGGITMSRMFRMNTEHTSEPSPPKRHSRRGELKQGATRIV